MVSKQEIIRRILKDWGDTPQSEICISILGYLSGVDSSTNHITYGHLRKVAATTPLLDQDLQAAIKYLCGERVHLLDMGFELIENEKYIEISKSEMKEARETGTLLHPDTGELIENFEKDVFVYFKPSRLSQQITP